MNVQNVVNTHQVISNLTRPLQAGLDADVAEDDALLLYGESVELLTQLSMWTDHLAHRAGLVPPETEGAAAPEEGEQTAPPA